MPILQELKGPIGGSQGAECGGLALGPPGMKPYNTPLLLATGCLHGLVARHQAPPGLLQLPFSSPESSE